MYKRLDIRPIRGWNELQLMTEIGPKSLQCNVNTSRCISYVFVPVVNVCWSRQAWLTQPLPYDWCWSEDLTWLIRDKKWPPLTRAAWNQTHTTRILTHLHTALVVVLPAPPYCDKWRGGFNICNERRQPITDSTTITRRRSLALIQNIRASEHHPLVCQ